MSKFQSYQDLIIGDYTRQAALERSQNPTPGPAVGEDALRAVIPCAVTCAVNGSIFNAPFDTSAYLLASLLPAEPSLMAALVQVNAPWLRHPALNAQVMAADVKVSLAISNGKSIPGLLRVSEARARGLWAACSADWQDAAWAVQELIRQVVLETPDEGHFAGLDDLLSLLEQVIACESPCVSDAGGIQLPGVLERRDGARQPYIEHGVVMKNGENWPIVFTDRSPEGFGIANAPRLGRGEIVTIESESGLRAYVEVRWWRDGRAGLKLISS